MKSLSSGRFVKQSWTITHTAQIFCILVYFEYFHTLNLVYRILGLITNNTVYVGIGPAGSARFLYMHTHMICALVDTSILVLNPEMVGPLTPNQFPYH